MKLASCIYKGLERVAVADGHALRMLPREFGSIMNAFAAGAVSTEGAPVDLSDPQLTLLPPIPRPDKILCVGVNYRDHAAEASVDEPRYPSLFVRFANSVVGAEQRIIAPSISKKFDFEGELAVVMGRRAWRVRTADALHHVAGYSCFAENSVRDFQGHARQVTAGKNFLYSGAFGPWLVTADEVGDPRDLELTTRVNGVVMQHASTANLIFPVAELISYISQFTCLEPGDVIATGTPSGVGALRDPPVWMKPGDTLEVEISRVGLLRNPVGPEPDISHSQGSHDRARTNYY